MAAEILHVTDHATRGELEVAIAALRAKQDRMPAHWLDRRAEIGDDIDDLIDEWIKAEV